MSTKGCFVLWTAILLCQGAYGGYLENTCGCPDQKNKYYNLKPLESKKDKLPSFSVNATKYKGYVYSYNPCSTFKIGPIANNSGCRKDVAICWWVPDLNESSATYKIIGNQRFRTCYIDGATPVMVYKIHPPNEFQRRNSTVRLECDETRRDNAFFNVVDEDNWVFQLRYFWDGCPTLQTNLEQSTERTVDPLNYIVPVGAGFGVILIFVVVPFFVWYKKQNKNNNIGEREHILHNNRGDQQANGIHNSFVERNQANGTRPRPIGSSYTRGDINVIRGAQA